MMGRFSNLFRQSSDKSDVHSWEDVFVVGGEPTHTYYARPDLEGKIRKTINRNKVCVVSGQTKLGKTVLLRKTLPKHVVVNGGNIKSEDDFWHMLAMGMSLPSSITSSSTQNDSSTAELSAEAGIAIAKIGTKITADMGFERTKAIEIAYPSKIGVIAELERVGKFNVPIVVDDFHFIRQDIQNSIIRALKGALFNGLPLIVVTVPRRTQEIPFIMSPEMSGRVNIIQIPAWELHELIFIPEEGFRLLGCTLSDWQLTSLADRASGSPHLMQEFCERICSKYSKCLQDNTLRSLKPEELEEIYMESAGALGRRIFKIISEHAYTGHLAGCTQGERAKFFLEVIKTLGRYGYKSETQPIDVKEFLILMRAGYAKTWSGDVYTALNVLSKIAATENSSIPVIEFDTVAQKIYITDPFFAFYVNTAYTKQSI